MKNFRKLLVWQKGMKIAQAAFELTEGFPAEEKYVLRLQITRSAISIPSNMAEESSRSSSKDQKRFLEIALGSSYELETQLLISDANNYGNPDIRKVIISDVDQAQKC